VRFQSAPGFKKVATAVFEMQQMTYLSSGTNHRFTKAMSKHTAALGTALFLVLAPGIVFGLIPWWITRWHEHETWSEVPVVPELGFVLIGFGVLTLVEAFARFAIEGLGTPAPVLPTQHLVIKGSYRYVRNPMYLAGLCIIFGQALVLGDWRLVVYGVVIWLCSHLFILGYEEPTLRRTYGAEYANYCADIPRWLPRLRRPTGT
jgi:protein-S-isoprenylcysteine O-methyltransferase Ste14